MAKRFVALGVLLLSCAPPAAVRGSDAEAEITQTLQAWRDARVAGDTAFLGRFYAKELRIQGTNGAVITREDDIRGFASGAIRPQFIRAEEMNVAVYGDVALATGRDHLKGTYGGVPGEGRVRFLNVLVRRDARWQLVASQGTWIR
jgi:ketosteroid isomerase-like protein